MLSQKKTYILNPLTSFGGSGSYHAVAISAVSHISKLPVNNGCYFPIKCVIQTYYKTLFYLSGTKGRC